jgi:pimeloyl-ACP methyl ester carboxylesterase
VMDAIAIDTDIGGGPVTAETSVFVSASDGLQLHVREYGARSAPLLPVVCLPGLSRTAQDFSVLATALSSNAKAPRRVLALDYRGRGLSEYDRNPANYSLAVELADLMAVLTVRDAAPAVMIGTSRGGILAMLLAGANPSSIAGVVLNDIGPVIETKGLMRIKSYVGKLPRPRTFEEGAEILRRLFDAQFPTLADATWHTMATYTWREGPQGLVPTYDVKLNKALAAVDAERGLPPLWAQFDGLARVPVMVIRGANSDILSAATVAAMQARRSIDVLEVPDQGHTPLLIEAEVIRRISRFIARCDEAAVRSGRSPPRAEPPTD